MADIKAQANGNWSATGTWAGGVVPGAGDSAYANGFSVTLDTNITCIELTNAAGGTAAATAGGGFSVAATRTINANVRNGATASSTVTVSANSPAVVALNGSVTGGSVANGYGVRVTGTATVNITGAVLGGSVNSALGVNVEVAGGIVNITGSVTGGTVAGASGAVLAANATMNITGNCTADKATAVANNSAAGAVTITGDCYGSTTAAGAYGAFNNTTGSLTVYGTAAAANTGAGSAGAFNGGTGTCFVQVARANNFPNGGITNGLAGAVQNSTSGFITLDAVEYGTGGWSAVSGRHFFRAAGMNYTKGYETNAGTALVMGEVSADYPVEANVRTGTSYAFGTKVGTCAVPPAGSVASGVPVDATTGTAALTPAALLGASLLTRLGQCATVQSTGDQLASFGG